MTKSVALKRKNGETYFVYPQLRICTSHIPDEFFEPSDTRKSKLKPGARPRTYAEDKALRSRLEAEELAARTASAKISTRRAIYTHSPKKRKASRTSPKPLSKHQLQRKAVHDAKNLHREVEQLQKELEQV
jgi:hypothetical protein